MSTIEDKYIYLSSVYQKVVPPPVFELVVQAMQLAPGGGAGGAGAGGLPLGVGTGMPAPTADASVTDIDESAPSVGSGAEWENVNE
jgi:hypothetical protein